MTNLGKLISRVIDLFTNLGAVFIIIMMLHISADVILRYLFKSAVEGTIEIVTNYYMIIIGFLSLCFTEEKNRNISVELIADQMPGWVQRHLNGFSYFFATVIFAFLTVRTFAEAQKKYDVGAYVSQGTTDIPIWPAYYFIPIGCALVLVVTLYKLVCYLTGATSGLNEKLDDFEDEKGEAGV